jgi:hydrogenase nickel incorporation protein HypA/HybF
MHELSIAEEVLDIVHQYVPVEDRGRIRVVNMNVGALSGVVVESLKFCFAAITGGTPMAGVTLSCRVIPYLLRCAGCGWEGETEPGLRLCPACGSADTTVLSGTELHVTDIELEDDHQVPP